MYVNLYGCALPDHNVERISAQNGWNKEVLREGVNQITPLPSKANESRYVHGREPAATPFLTVRYKCKADLHLTLSPKTCM